MSVEAPPRRLGARRFRSRCPAVVPLALFCLLAFALFWQSLVGGKILSDGDNILFQDPFVADVPAGVVRPTNPELDDPVLVFSSDLLVLRRDLASGGNGAWNPYQAAGRPLIASQQTAPFFPLTWLALIFSFWHAAAWIAALKLVLGACGLYLLARWTGLARGPAALAAVAYGFSTFFVDQVQFPTSAVMATAPWTMLMAARVARFARPLDALGLIVAVGLLLCGGSPEFIAIGGGGVTAVALYELLRAPREREPVPQASRRLRLLLLLASGAGGILLAAAAVFPFAQYLAVANTVSRGGAPNFPNNILYAFLFPELWGRPDLAIGQFGPINYLTRTAYFGVLPVLLALAGLVARRPRSVHVFWGGFTAGALLVAMNTPVHTFLSSVPGPADVDLLYTLYLVVLGGALLAGLGLQRWLDGSHQERRRMLIVLVIAALAPVVFLLRHLAPFAHLGAALAELPGLRRSFTGTGYIEQAVAWRWLIIAAVGVGLLSLGSRLGRRWTSALAVCLVAADLVAINYDYNPAIPLAEANPATPPALAYVQKHAAHTRISGTLLPTEVSLQANMAERYGLIDVGSYNFPKAERWARLWGGYGQSTGDQDDWDPALPRAVDALDTFAVRYVVVQHGATEPAGLGRVFSSPSGDVYEDPNALPRAWVAYSWRVADSAPKAAAATVASTTTQLARTPILEGAPAPPPAVPGPITRVRFLIDRDEHVRLLTYARRPGYLVLDDSYYPGWHATVDGRSAPILAANENFRAVAVTAGRHVVDFSYDPATFRISLWLSLLSFISVVSAAGWLLWRRWQRGPEPVSS